VEKIHGQGDTWEESKHAGGEPGRNPWEELVSKLEKEKRAVGWENGVEREANER